MIQKVIFIGSVSLGLINKFILYNNSFISSYGNDLLTMPILLSLYSILFRKQVSFKMGLLLTLFVSILSEFIRPYINPFHSVFDLWDIVAYFVGMIIYFIIMRCKDGKI